MGKVSPGADVLKLCPSSEDGLCAVVNVLRCGSPAWEGKETWKSTVRWLIQ